jgi:D-3-phosphoglycerate dehydrogenase
MSDAGRDDGRPIVAVMGAQVMGMGDLARTLPDIATVLVEPGVELLGGADAAVAWQDTHLTRAVLEHAPRLRVVTHLGTAIHVDVDAATELGIVVLHSPGHNATSVAEHTIGLLLALMKQIPRSDRVVRSRTDWEVGAAELFGHEVHGKTIGLLGFGAIGRIVARIAGAGLGMEVIVYERDAAAVGEAGYEAVELDELLERSDVVSVHLPLTDATHHLIDRHRLARMKPTAVLIHTSRGEVVDFVALDAALRDGTITGAAFDTWPDHRANPDSPLIDLDNVVMTQHNAGLTVESSERMARAVVCGITEVLAGRRPTLSRLANPEVWDARRSYGALPPG